MEFDNPGSDQWKSEQRSDISDFSEAENNQGDKKSKKDKLILGTKKKEKKKETRYATLGDPSSGEEEEKDGKKKSKKKGFQFGSAKKEKKEKKDKDRDTKDQKDSRKKEKKDKEKEKEKAKLKLKKLKPEGDFEGKVEDAPVFGVPLALAVERSRCHDGIKLPVVVRECIDYIEENGLKVEGIYRSSGVKSKVNKLKIAYNTRQSVSLAGAEPAVVASLLKLFLRELPNPVLTQQLIPRFEEVAKVKDVSKMFDGLVSLIKQLPECNRTLLEWVLVHMNHVIQNEKQNKMTLQNVSIVLSPSMQISHGVLYGLFKNSTRLFGHVEIKKYVPPISGQSGVNVLPESPEGIEEEMKKQESLLEDLHKEISLGVASKATEEQLWEQQRIVTQLKRKLRLAKSSQKGEDSKPEQDEEMNFSLQKPLNSSLTESDKKVEPTTKENVPVNVSTEKNSKPDLKDTLSSPEDKEESKEHRVTVQIHRTENLDLEKIHQSENPDQEQGHVTVIKLTEKEKDTSPKISESEGKEENSVSVEKNLSPEKPDDDVDSSTFKARTPPEVQKPGFNQPEVQTGKPELPTESSFGKPVDKLKPNVGIKPYENIEIKVKKVDFEPKDKVEEKNVARMGLSKSEEKPSLRSIDEVKNSGAKPGGFPMLPPPPGSFKPSTRGCLKPSILPQQENIIKSKSLPRGLPSDIGAFDRTSQNRSKSELNQTDGKKNEKEQLIWEELRLKFEYEELLNLKSELERKRKTERREVAELQEEIATMQTLYQYRTYSIDSSESEGEEEHYQIQADKRQLLRQLALEQADLEKKKMFLLSKLEAERSSCLQLRVQIRLEQERLKRRGL